MSARCRPAQLQVLIARLTGVAREMGAVLRRACVQPQHQGTRRLLRRAVHRRGRAARAGRAHPGPPRVDAGVGGGGDRALRPAPPGARSARRTRSSSTTRSPVAPTSTTSPSWRRVSTATAGRLGREPGAPRRRRRSRTGLDAGRRHRDLPGGAASPAGPTHRRRCATCCWPTRARPTSGPATSTRSSVPTASVWPASARAGRRPPFARGARLRRAPDARRLMRCPTARGASPTSIDSFGSEPAPAGRRPIRSTCVIAVDDRSCSTSRGTDDQRAGNVNAVEAVTRQRRGVRAAVARSTRRSRPTAGALRPVRGASPAGVGRRRGAAGGGRCRATSRSASGSPTSASVRSRSVRPARSGRRRRAR